MKKEYEISQKDYWKFNIFNSMRSLKSKVSLFIIAILVPLLMTIFCASLSLDAMTSLLIVLISGAAADIFIYFFIKKKIMEIPKEVGGITGRRTIELDDVGIITETENKKLFQKYKGVKKLGENANYIYIYMDEVVAEIVPKRSFDNEGELNEFKKVLINKTDLFFNAKPRNK